MLPSKESKALATKLFEAFYAADSFADTLDLFGQIVDVLGIRGAHINDFFPILKVSQEVRKVSQRVRMTSKDGDIYIGKGLEKKIKVLT